MKQLVWIVLAVIGGFLLGGLGPRRQLAEQQEKISALEDRVAVAEKKAAHRASDRFLGLPALPDLPPPPRPHPVAKPAAKEAGGDADASPSPEASPVDPLSAFRLAVDAQRLRAKQSRAALSEAAKLNAEDEAAIDDVVAKMNAELARHAQEIADVMKAYDEGQDPDPQEMLAITHDVSGILLDSQAAFQQAVGPSPSGLDPSATQVWNYVDLSIFQDVVQNLPASAGGPPAP